MYLNSGIKYFSLVFVFVAMLMSANAQTSIGFKEGDKAFGRWITKELLKETALDTTSYFFTIAVVQFDSAGQLNKVTFMTEGNTDIKNKIANLLLKTTSKWNARLTKNNTQLIPFEIMNQDVIPVQKDRMIASEFMQLFKRHNAIPCILHKPITVIKPAKEKMYKQQ